MNGPKKFLLPSWRSVLLSDILKTYPIFDTRWKHNTTWNCLGTCRYDFVSYDLITDPWGRKLPPPWQTHAGTNSYVTTVEGHAVPCLIYNEKPSQWF
jgi:hypothetical protein